MTLLLLILFFYITPKIIQQVNRVIYVKYRGGLRVYYFILEITGFINYLRTYYLYHLLKEARVCSQRTQQFVHRGWLPMLSFCIIIEGMSLKRLHRCYAVIFYPKHVRKSDTRM